MLNSRRVTLQSAELAFGSITGTSAGTANTVITLAKDAGNVGVENTTDVQLVITIGGVQAKRIPAGAYRVLDLATNGGRIASGTVIGVFRAAGAPTSGVIEVVAVPYP